MAHNLPNLKSVPATYGPLADDALAELLADCQNTSMLDTVQVPGAVLRLCVAPALRELQDRRRADRGRPALRPVPGPTPRPKDGGDA